MQLKTAGRKLGKITAECFCHNNGIKKSTGNVLPIVGGRTIVLVEITVQRQSAGTYCLKEDPPANANVAHGSTVFLYSVWKR